VQKPLLAVEELWPFLSLLIDELLQGLAEVSGVHFLALWNMVVRDKPTGLMKFCINILIHEGDL
jgi:hypothetical protein